MISHYLQKEGDDLEASLTTLFEHFQFVQQTSLDELARGNNNENLSGLELINKSN